MFDDTDAEHNETCDRCKSKRVASLSVKCSDRCNVGMNDGTNERTDYAPEDMGIGGHFNGDYVRFAWCLDCGKIQGEFPLPETALERGEPSSV